MEVNMMDTIDTMAAMDSMSAAEMNDQSDLDDQYPNQDTIPSIYTELFPGASDIFGKGETFIDLFDGNEYAESWKKNVYYPFASQPEWELALYLLKSGLSMAATDEFLNLQMVSAGIPLWRQMANL